MDSEINGWKYKETQTRKGKTIIFGKLDELLFKYYHVNTIGALDQYRSNYKGQYIINCKIEKNRAGSLGNIRYLFQAKNGRWSEINENKKEGVSENGKYTVKKPSV